MIRIRGIVILLLMAGITVGRRTGVSVGMTCQTGQHGMRSCQWKLSLVMVKSCRRPGIGTMAFGTVMAKIIGYMIWISRGIKILLMTGVAVGRCTGITVRMTGDALQRQMRSC